MRLRPFLALCALALQPVPLAAQQQLNLTATVPVRSPTGSGTRNLTFGTVAPVAGSTQIVDVPAATGPLSASVQSGEFRYNITSLRGLDFSVTVPAALTSAGLPSLPVSFAGSQYGAYCVTMVGVGCTLVNFNPASGSSVRVCRNVVGGGACHPVQVFPTGSQMAVYVGGRLSVPPSAMAGFYSGTITLTIVQVY